MMKSRRISFLLAALGMTAFLLAGCGRQHDEHDHHQDHSTAEKKSEDHDHTQDREEPSPAGASFKTGKGVFLSDETRRNLGVETAIVSERKLPLEIRFTAQVFGEHHKPTAAETYHAECTAKAAGLIAQDKVASVQPGAATQLATKDGEALCGVVLGISRALAIGEVEVIVGITNSAERLKAGEFLSGSIAIPREEAVSVVPLSAVLHTAEGSFAYKKNGEAYSRTPVKTAGEAEGFVEITDGLSSGDVVVARPVEKLWLIELRATKGGGHSH